MNFSNVRMVRVENHHLRGTAGLPPDLMTPAKASKPFMKESGPEARPPPESTAMAFLSEGGEIGASARAPLEEHAFGLGKIEDRFGESLHRDDVKHAG